MTYSTIKEYRPMSVRGELDAITLWCSKELYYKQEKDDVITMIKINSIQETQQLAKEGKQIYWGVTPEEEWGYLVE